MKSISLSLWAALFFFATAAWADHHAVFVQGVYKLDSDACAISLEINANGQNAFEAVDRVQVDGSLVASLGLTASAINAGGNVDAGDRILFASNAFQARTGLTPDVLFTDAVCGSFDGGSSFTFVIDDPDFGTPPVVIDALSASSDFGGDDTAMVKAFQGGSAQFVDLDGNTLTVANNAGSTAVLGSPPGGDGGCAMTSRGSAMSRGGWILALTLPLPFFLSWRWMKSLKRVKLAS